MSAPDTPALDWVHLVADATNGLDIARTATAAEGKAVAEALGVLACERLEVRYTLTPRSGGRFRLAGHLSAHVVQACIVSLEPVPEAIEEDFEVMFRPEVSERAARRIADAGDDIEADATILDAEDVEPIRHGRLDVGRVVYETLATALEPYPRAPGAALERHEAGGADAAAASPFAALARLKRES